MEGKEVRFGAAVGGLFMAVTTGTSTGAINSWHDSFQPIAGLVPLFNMELGEITPGGIGAGMYGMLVIGAILAVFIAGLMVGRTPEYLGKKVEAFEIKMAMLVALVLGASILGFTAIASVLPEGTAGPLNPGPHGFSEILYAFSSQTGNNGSAFAGLTGNTPFYNITGAFAMLIGRYGMIVPILALAGSMAMKRRVAPSLGTFPTTGVLWVVLLIGVVDHRRRAHVLPGPRAGSDRRAAPPERRKGLLMALLSVDLGRGTRRFQRFVTLGGAKPSGGEPPKPRGILDPDLLRSAIPHAFRKLDPRLLIKNPVMFVVEITAVLVTVTAIADVVGAQPTGVGGLGFPIQIGIWLWFTVLFATYAEAVAEARGRAQAATLRRTRSETTAHRRRADGTLENVGSVRAAQGRHHRRRGRRDDRRRRRRHRGHRVRQRGRDHRRVGAGPQGAGHGHPQLGHRRHDARQRPDRRPGHVRPGRDLPRPDDRPGRGRQAPAHAERDRARDPARRADDHLPDGDGHPAAVRRVRRHDRRHGRPDGPPRLPHPDDDRRAAVRDRHRRHGPRRAVQRPGDERPRRRGIGRRRRHPARQDGHDHLRQPAGRLDHRRPRASPRPRRPKPRSCRRSGTRRRRAAPSSSSPASGWRRSGARRASATTPRSRRLARPSPRRSRSAPRPAPAASGRPAGIDDPEGSRRRDREEGRHPAGRASSPTPTGSPTSAPRRSSSRARAASSASSSSRTRSRKGSSSASPSSAGWASAR